MLCSPEVFSHRRLQSCRTSDVHVIAPPAFDDQPASSFLSPQRLPPSVLPPDPSCSFSHLPSASQACMESCPPTFPLWVSHCEEPLVFFPPGTPCLSQTYEGTSLSSSSATSDASESASRIGDRENRDDAKSISTSWNTQNRCNTTEESHGDPDQPIPHRDRTELNSIDRNLCSSVSRNSATAEKPTDRLNGCHSVIHDTIDRRTGNNDTSSFYSGISVCDKQQEDGTSRYLTLCSKPPLDGREKKGMSCGYKLDLRDGLWRQPNPTLSGLSRVSKVFDVGDGKCFLCIITNSYNEPSSSLLQIFDISPQLPRHHQVPSHVLSSSSPSTSSCPPSNGTQPESSGTSQPARTASSCLSTPSLCVLLPAPVLSSNCISILSGPLCLHQSVDEFPSRRFASTLLSDIRASSPADLCQVSSRRLLSEGSGEGCTCCVCSDPRENFFAVFLAIATSDNVVYRIHCVTKTEKTRPKPSPNILASQPRSSQLHASVSQLSQYVPFTLLSSPPPASYVPSVTQSLPGSVSSHLLAALSSAYTITSIPLPLLFSPPASKHNGSFPACSFRSSLSCPVSQHASPEQFRGGLSRKGLRYIYNPSCLPSPLHIERFYASYGIAATTLRPVAVAVTPLSRLGCESVSAVGGSNDNAERRGGVKRRKGGNGKDETAAQWCSVRETGEGECRMSRIVPVDSITALNPDSVVVAREHPPLLCVCTHRQDRRSRQACSQQEEQRLRSGQTQLSAATGKLLPSLVSWDSGWILIRYSNGSGGIMCNCRVQKWPSGTNKCQVPTVRKRSTTTEVTPRETSLSSSGSSSPREYKPSASAATSSVVGDSWCGVCSVAEASGCGRSCARAVEAVGREAQERNADLGTGAVLRDALLQGLSVVTCWKLDSPHRASSTAGLQGDDNGGAGETGGAEPVGGECSSDSEIDGHNSVASEEISDSCHNRGFFGWLPYLGGGGSRPKRKLEQTEELAEARYSGKNIGVTVDTDGSRNHCLSGTGVGAKYVEVVRVKEWNKPVHDQMGVWYVVSYSHDQLCRWKVTLWGGYRQACLDLQQIEEKSLVDSDIRENTGDVCVSTCGGLVCVRHKQEFILLDVGYPTTIVKLMTFKPLQRNAYCDPKQSFSYAVWGGSGPAATLDCEGEGTYCYAGGMGMECTAMCMSAECLWLYYESGVDDLEQLTICFRLPSLYKIPLKPASRRPSLRLRRSSTSSSTRLSPRSSNQERGPSSPLLSPLRRRFSLFGSSAPPCEQPKPVILPSAAVEGDADTRRSSWWARLTGGSHERTPECETQEVGRGGNEECVGGEVSIVFGRAHAEAVYRAQELVCGLGELRNVYEHLARGTDCKRLGGGLFGELYKNDVVTDWDAIEFCRWMTDHFASRIAVPGRFSLSAHGMLKVVLMFFLEPNCRRIEQLLETDLDYLTHEEIAKSLEGITCTVMTLNSCISRSMRLIELVHEVCCDMLAAVQYLSLYTHHRHNRTRKRLAHTVCRDPNRCAPLSSDRSASRCVPYSAFDPSVGFDGIILCSATLPEYFNASKELSKPAATDGGAGVTLVEEVEAKVCGTLVRGCVLPSVLTVCRYVWSLKEGSGLDLYKNSWELHTTQDRMNEETRTEGAESYQMEATFLGWVGNMDTDRSSAQHSTSEEEVSKRSNTVLLRDLCRDQSKRLRAPVTVVRPAAVSPDMAILVAQRFSNLGSEDYSAKSDFVSQLASHPGVFASVCVGLSRVWSAAMLSSGVVGDIPLVISCDGVSLIRPTLSKWDKYHHTISSTALHTFRHLRRNSPSLNSTRRHTHSASMPTTTSAPNSPSSLKESSPIAFMSPLFRWRSPFSQSRLDCRSDFRTARMESNRDRRDSDGTATVYNIHGGPTLVDLIDAGEWDKHSFLSRDGNRDAVATMWFCLVKKLIALAPLDPAWRLLICGWVLRCVGWSSLCATRQEAFLLIIGGATWGCKKESATDMAAEVMNTWGGSGYLTQSLFSEPWYVKLVEICWEGVEGGWIACVKEWRKLFHGDDAMLGELAMLTPIVAQSSNKDFLSSPHLALTSPPSSRTSSTVSPLLLHCVVHPPASSTVSATPPLVSSPSSADHIFTVAFFSSVTSLISLLYSVFFSVSFFLPRLNAPASAKPSGTLLPSDGQRGQDHPETSGTVSGSYYYQLYIARYQRHPPATIHRQLTDEGERQRCRTDQENTETCAEQPISRMPRQGLQGGGTSDDEPRQRSTDSGKDGSVGDLGAMRDDEIVKDVRDHCDRMVPYLISLRRCLNKPQFYVVPSSTTGPTSGAPHYIRLTVAEMYVSTFLYRDQDIRATCRMPPSSSFSPIEDSRLSRTHVATQTTTHADRPCIMTDSNQDGLLDSRSLLAASLGIGLWEFLDDWQALSNIWATHTSTTHPQRNAVRCMQRYLTARIALHCLVHPGAHKDLTTAYHQINGSLESERCLGRSFPLGDSDQESLGNIVVLLLAASTNTSFCKGFRSLPLTSRDDDLGFRLAEAPARASRAIDSDREQALKKSASSYTDTMMAVHYLTHAYSLLNSGEVKSRCGDTTFYKALGDVMSEEVEQLLHARQNQDVPRGLLNVCSDQCFALYEKGGLLGCCVRLLGQIEELSDSKSKVLGLWQRHVTRQLHVEHVSDRSYYVTRDHRQCNASSKICEGGAIFIEAELNEAHRRFLRSVLHRLVLCNWPLDHTATFAYQYLREYYNQEGDQKASMVHAFVGAAAAYCFLWHGDSSGTKSPNGTLSWRQGDDNIFTNVACSIRGFRHNMELRWRQSALDIGSMGGVGVEAEAIDSADTELTKGVLCLMTHPTSSSASALPTSRMLDVCYDRLSHCFQPTSDVYSVLLPGVYHSVVLHNRAPDSQNQDSKTPRRRIHRRSSKRGRSHDDGVMDELDAVMAEGSVEAFQQPTPANSVVTASCVRKISALILGTKLLVVAGCVAAELGDPRTIAVSLSDLGYIDESLDVSERYGVDIMEILVCFVGYINRIESSAAFYAKLTCGNMRYSVHLPCGVGAAGGMSGVVRSCWDKVLSVVRRNQPNRRSLTVLAAMLKKHAETGVPLCQFTKKILMSSEFHPVDFGPLLFVLLRGGQLQDCLDVIHERLSLRIKDCLESRQPCVFPVTAILHVREELRLRCCAVEDLPAEHEVSEASARGLDHLLSIYCDKAALLEEAMLQRADIEAEFMGQQNGDTRQPTQ
eukprot:GHVQ01012645.1.p1 GENE.GHVQ01012645.1~~GHVQ01012645.1.p1  ORF type:complete len:3174 (+),score=378.94 GHVQ01012645.1:151-9672(+)